MRAKVREATRPEKWWGPLAAAAVIGAIAVGVLQLVPQDRDAATDGAKAVVSDTPADTGATRRDARLPAAASAPAPARESIPATGGAPDARANAESQMPFRKQGLDRAALEKPVPKELDAGGGAAPSSGLIGAAGAPAANEPAPPPPSSEPERKKQSSMARAETSIAKSAPAPFPYTVVPTPVAPGPALPAPAAPAPAVPPPRAAPASAPQPFPAETFKRGAAAEVAQAPSAPVDVVKPDVSRKEEAFAAAPRKSAGASATGGMSANATAPADPDALRDKLAVAPPPAALGQTPAAGGNATAPRGRADSPSLAAAPAAIPQRDAVAEPARQLATAKVAAERRADPAVDAKAKERARLPVADWILLILKLRDEGRQDDVALELKAFRAVHADAQTLLPPDLRDAPVGTR
jgi:hypothetical protein